MTAQRIYLLTIFHLFARKMIKEILSFFRKKIAKKEILFSDFNYSDSYLDVDFWNQIFKFPKYFKFAYLTCAGELFGWYDYSIFVSNVYDDSVIGSSMRSGKISYLDTYLEKPLLIANGVIDLLKEYVNYDCATDLFINDFPLVCP